MVELEGSWEDGLMRSCPPKVGNASERRRRGRRGAEVGDNWVLRVLAYHADCETKDTKPRHRSESKKTAVVNFWNYIPRRELNLPSALALRWLCDGGDKATAPQREQRKCHFELLELYFKARIGSSECSGITLAV